MSKRSNASDRILGLDKALRDYVAHVASYLGDEETFVSLYFKHQDDGTVLAVAKRYGPDGGPQVCFGGGYGVIGAMLSLNATIASDNWKTDKPYRKPPK